MPAAESNSVLGLYTLDGGFRSQQEIIDKNTQHGLEFVTPVTKDEKTFAQWGVIFDRRQEERHDSFGIPEHIQVSIKDEKPIFIALIGDTHSGAESVDYKRLTNDILSVNQTDGAYAMFLGDITDSFFWGGTAQDKELGSFEEQNAYLRKGAEMLAHNKKLIAMWGGDHDKWSADRGETIYRRIVEELGVHYLEGVSYVTTKVGVINYRIAGAHRHNGFSIYNNAHSPMRVYRDDAEGSDICVTAHNHVKGYARQSVKEYGGEGREVHFISLPTYKETDDYARKKGFHRLSEEETGGMGIILWPNEKRIVVATSIKEGVEQVKFLRSFPPKK